MTIDDRLPEHLDEEDVESVEAPGILYEVEHERGAFGDELLLIRLLSDEYDARELLNTDIAELESRFYDDVTPNHWNIRLIWAYDEDAAPDPEIRAELENDTRFAIRRCVPVEALADFATPLQTSRAKLRNITNQFDRSDLIDNIIDQDLGFLLENGSRDDKFDRIKSGVTPKKSKKDVPSLTTSTDPLDQFVDSVNLGDEFRPDSNLDELDTNSFTLLYGRNGTGKTSLLEGIALGLVGQIRHEDGRADDYDGLYVTLNGDSEPLSTDSSSVNDRVASWFGFRPHGPARKYIEFYRVNYHEAGAATRFIESGPDNDIEQTLWRLLFGEELEDARKDKNELLDRLKKEISKNENEIQELETEAQIIRDKQQRVSAVFSQFEIASENLSPALKAVLAGTSDSSEQDSELADEPVQPEQWATWEQRFGDLKDGLDALPASYDDPETPGELQRKLQQARDRSKEIINDIEQIKQLQSARTRLTKLGDRYISEEANKLPASVSLVELIVHSHGLTSEQLTQVRQILKQKIEFGMEPNDTNSIGEWRDAAAEKVVQHLERLREQKENIEELDRLDERRRQLQSQIRKQTEEYLSITDELYHCPACYKEQTRDELLSRERPEKLHGDESGSVPEALQNQISELKTAKEVLELSEWDDIDYEVTVRFPDLCGMAAFQQFWTDYVESTVDENTSWDATSEAVDTFASVLEDHIRDSPDDIVLSQAIDSGIKGMDASITKLMDGIPEIDSDDVDILTLENQYQSQEDDLIAALDVLDKFWPNSAFHQQLRVENDYRVIQRTLKKVEETPEAMETPEHYQEQLQSIEREIDDLQGVIRRCRDGIDRLETAFETSAEGELKSLVADHMTVISTLFKSFQLPYEFEEVRYQDESFVVQRRHEDGVEPISEMSSGQRAALALAIFVTNNIAHQRAPPLMMLDEPFAHLDDINSVSFFNLLIELAMTGDRQIIFATASEDIAELLQRKVGESPRFTRVNIPATHPTIDTG